METATARDPHHFAVLIGYGATAVYPYLAYHCIQDMVRIGEIPKRRDAIGRILSFGTDGKPNKDLVNGLGAEVLFGLLHAIALGLTLAG